MRSLAVAIACVGACVAETARAEELSRVEVSIAANDTDAAALQLVLRDLLSTTGLETSIARVPAIDPRAVVEPPATFAAGVARVFVDVDGKVARIYLVDAAWARVLLRRIPLPHGLDEIAREQIGHVVAGSVSALQAGAQIGIVREDARAELGVEQAKAPPPPPSSPSPPPPIPIRPPPPAPRSQSSLAVGYEGAAWAPGVASHALGATVSLRLPSAIGFAAGGLVRVPLVVDHAAVGVRVDAWALRGEASYAPAIAASTRASFAVGGGVDRLRIEPHATGLGVAAPVRHAWVPVLRVTLGVETRLSPSVAARLGFFVESDLDARSYVVLREGGAAETVVEPFRARPGLALSIATSIF